MLYNYVYIYIYIYTYTHIISTYTSPASAARTSQRCAISAPAVTLQTSPLRRGALSMCVYIYIYIYIYIHTCTHTYIHIHVHCVSIYIYILFIIIITIITYYKFASARMSVASRSMAWRDAAALQHSIKYVQNATADVALRQT